MHFTFKPILLTLSFLLLTVGVSGCQPADAPRMSSTTHTVEPPEVSPSSNTTLPPSPPVADSGDTGSGADAENEGPAPNENVSGETPAATTARRRTVDSALLASAGKSTVATETKKSSVPKPQPGKTLDLTFDDLKFDIEPDEPFERPMLPQAIEDLSGQKIRIGGYILPGFQQRDIKQFVLVRDNMECCFGPGAALYDCILVEMEGRGIDFTVRPITVEGTFTVEEYKLDDVTRAIYHIDGTGIR